MVKIMDSLDVANFFILKNNYSGNNIDYIKLTKMCYLAHCWCLGFTDKPLLSEGVSVYEYGPIIQSLHNYFDGDVIFNFINKSQMYDYNKLPSDTKKILEFVYDKYNNYSSLELSSLCQSEGSPWYMAKKENKTFIPNMYIREYYKNLLKNINQ